MQACRRRADLVLWFRVQPLLLVTVWSVSITPWTSATTIVDFEDLSLPAQTAAPGDASQSPFGSRGVQFNRTWSVEFNCCPGAWAYSNQSDLATPGYGNSFSAYALPDGGGAGGLHEFRRRQQLPPW